MMKPGVGTYDRFKELFDQYSKEAGKEQYLIPYFIAAHPGTTDEDMLEARAVAEAERLPRRPGAGVPARRRWRPRPRCTTPARTRCASVTRDSDEVHVAEGPASERRLHKAFLRYHDAEQLADAARGAASAWAAPT